MRIPDDKAEEIAEKMSRSIASYELMDLYDSIEYPDPIEGLKDAIKTNPLAVMDLLAEIIDNKYWETWKNDKR